ncbi:hypothetical protein GCM10027610_012050 [Dactylosporangium cerinum]
MPTFADQLDVAADLLALLHDTDTEPRTDPQLEALTLAVAADLPVLLWGEPGIGKTAALTQLAEALDLPLTTVIASVHEPSDFSGLPVVGDDPAVQGVPMAPPDWAVRLVRAGRGLLFLDELSTAPPAVQAALLRLVLERRVGALRLPPGVRIVAAANPGRPRRTAGSSARRSPTGSSTSSGRTTTTSWSVASAGPGPALRCRGWTRSGWVRRSRSPAAPCAGCSPPVPGWCTSCRAARRAAAVRGRRRAAGTWRCG